MPMVWHGMHILCMLIIVLHSSKSSLKVGNVPCRCPRKSLSSLHSPLKLACHRLDVLRSFYCARCVREIAESEWQPKRMASKPNVFNFVYIPEEASEPIEQWEETFDPKNEEAEIKAFTDRCKKHFSKRCGPRTPAQKAARRAALMKNVPGNSGVDEVMLDTATAMSMVEHTSLLSNSKDNDFVGVNLYTDDEASFSGAGINRRASEIASCCGIALQVNGDAFIGRTYDNGDDFRRLDFKVSEVSSDAAWVQEARAQNERKRQRDSPAALESRMRGSQPASMSEAAPQPSPSKPLSTAEALKEQGNAALKQGNLQQAVKLYSEALEADSTLAAAYNNRALAHLKLDNLADAEADCSYVLRLDPRNVKAFLRRGSAREAMQRLAEAVEDYQQAGVLDPKSKEAHSKLISAKQAMSASAPQ